MLLGLAHFRAFDTARKPAANVAITLRWMLPFTKNHAEATVTTNENGVAIFAVPAQQLPQMPIEADYKVGATTGRVTVGGNNATPITEITVNAA